MNAESGNKLLKLIEEPPEGTLFLLIAPSPDDLLSTIVSRCQLIHVPPLSSEEIADHLIVSGQTSDQNKAQMAASLADGDLRQAVRLLDLDDSLLQYTDWFVQLTRICYAARLTDLLNWTSELGKSTRDELIAFFRFSAHLLQEYTLTLGFGCSRISGCCAHWFQDECFFSIDAIERPRANVA